MINGRRRPSRGGTSRMNREVHVRFCEGLGVKFPGPTRHEEAIQDVSRDGGFPRKQSRLPLRYSLNR
jgi:hypothetical protein